MNLRDKTDVQLTWMAEMPKNTIEDRVKALLELERRGALTDYQTGLMSRLRKESPSVFTTITTEARQKPNDGVALYPRWAVFMFCLFFSPLIGSALMALNLRNLKLNDQIVRCLLMGLVTSLASVAIAQQFDASVGRSVQLFLNVLAAILIDQLFWIKNIGRTFAYTKKPVWVPLGIMFALSLLFAYYAIESGLITPMQE